jgi:hypothetical protein
MENRDRAMQFEVDSDVQAVLEFMQANVPATKLVAVSESAAQMGRLLWGHFPKESFDSLSLRALLPSSTSRVTQPTSTEFDRSQSRVGGDSVEAACGSGQ